MNEKMHELNYLFVQCI